MVKTSKKNILVLLVLAVLILGGCTRLDSLKVKYGFRNTDFEFMNSQEISKIIIQSTRDKGFRFIVTDKSTITGLYESLSTAKKVEEIISHEPDYVFEIHDMEGHIIYYNYVAGVSDQEQANFYNEEGSYAVTDRIDNNLIQNLYTIRKPKFFQEIYYGSFIDLIKTVKEEYNGKSVGIKFYDDIETLKYQLSRDIEVFREEALKEGAVVLSHGETADVVLEVNTQGYTTIVFKAVVTLKMNAEYVKKDYYILGNYVNDMEGWETIISDTKPEGF
ncbi:hypothetical protein ACHAL6_10980 [Proteiniclasticum sp. C24MP]|uniref:hypothetical protein n=1 Tax=Proteiniclasticum sp. C24MP TaxID=3374101 RepID=UPI003754A7C7